MDKSVEDRVKELQARAEVLEARANFSLVGLALLTGFMLLSRRNFSGKTVVAERFVLVEKAKFVGGFSRGHARHSH
jgi:hypothetical protein